MIWGDALPSERCPWSQNTGGRSCSEVLTAWPHGRPRGGAQGHQPRFQLPEGALTRGFRTCDPRGIFQVPAQNGQLTCAETFVPSLPLLLNCNGPKRFHVGGSGGMLSVGHAACTEYAELSHQSRRQSRGAAIRRTAAGTVGGGGPRLGLWFSLAQDPSLLVPLCTGTHCCHGAQCLPPHLRWSQSHTSVASRLLGIPQIPNSLVSHCPCCGFRSSLFPALRTGFIKALLPGEEGGGLLTPSLQRRGSSRD